MGNGTHPNNEKVIRDHSMDFGESHALNCNSRHDLLIRVYRLGQHVREGYAGQQVRIQELRSLRRSVEGFGLFVNCSCKMREAASMVATNAVIIKDSRTWVDCSAIGPIVPSLRVRPRYSCGCFQRPRDTQGRPRYRRRSTDGRCQRGVGDLHQRQQYPHRWTLCPGQLRSWLP